jgi:SAM-dependent methyltransferase
MIFQDSKLAHKYLDGLKGIEVGGSAHNPFNLDTINVDYTDEMTVYKQEEINLCGTYRKVDIVADAMNLPFEDESYDFVISSHQIEHCYNLIDTIREYERVVKPDGYIFIIAPRPDVCPDDKNTSFKDFLSREVYYNNNGDGGHCSVCSLETMIDVFEYIGIPIVEALNEDDKVGNGFLIIGRKV